MSLTDWALPLIGFALFLGGCVLVLSLWERIRTHRKEQADAETFRMIDQLRDEQRGRLATFQGRGPKGFSDARKVERMAGVVEKKERLN